MCEAEADNWVDTGRYREHFDLHVYIGQENALCSQALQSYQGY